MKYDIVIVGSGLTGATIAALNTNKRILIIEKGEIGGLCRTEKMGKIDVHKHGAHIFHTNNKRVWDFVTGWADFNGYIHQVNVDIEGQIFPLPINLDTYQRLYGIDSPELAQQLIDKSDADNFEDYVIDVIGPDLYDKYYKGYTTKMWGIDPKELPAFIAHRIPVRTSRYSLYFNDKYQGVPLNGYTDMMMHMTSHCDFENADFNADRNYYESLADKVVYTGAIDEYFDYIWGELPYRTIEHKTSIVEGVQDYQGVAVMNYSDEDVPFIRIIEHKHLNWVDEDFTVISVEHPRQWRRSGNHVRMYPIPTQNNEDLYQRYLEMDHKAIFAGRLGQYKYLNMDQCIEHAMEIQETHLS